MNTKNLITTICLLVAKELGEEYEVSVRQVQKNNGVLLHGLVIQRREVNIAPTIYLENYIKAFQAGASLPTIVASILDVYKEKALPPSFDVESLLHFDQIREHIIFSLINTSKNEEFLKDIPSLPYLDLSIIFKVNLPSPYSDNATFTIHHSHLKLWQKTIDDLYEAAYANTPILFPAKIQDMLSLVMGLLEEIEEIEVPPIDDAGPMFVLSNTEKLYGCSCILYPDVLEKFADTVDCDLFVLPSSLHEVILLPALDMVDKRRLSDMVQEVNASIVSQDDFLSDNVYYYSHKTKKLEVVCL